MFRKVVRSYWYYVAEEWKFFLSSWVVGIVVMGLMYFGVLSESPMISSDYAPSRVMAFVGIALGIFLIGFSSYIPWRNQQMDLKEIFRAAALTALEQDIRKTMTVFVNAMLKFQENPKDVERASVGFLKEVHQFYCTNLGDLSEVSGRFAGAQWYAGLRIIKATIGPSVDEWGNKTLCLKVYKRKFNSQDVSQALDDETDVIWERAVEFTRYFNARN